MKNKNSDFLNRVLTFEQGCEYTGFKRSYMYQLTCARKIPFSKPNGKTIFFDREKLEAWMLSNANTPDAKQIEEDRKKKAAARQKESEEMQTAAATYVATHELRL